jgi:hypothetical protein
VNFALVESIKRVLKAKTILGCDVSKEDNVNLFFSKRYSGSFLNRRGAVREVRSRTLGYDIKFPQEFAVFSPQSSSTL